MQFCIVQQDLSTISQRELRVADILSFLLHHFLQHNILFADILNDFHNLRRVIFGHEQTQVGHNAGCPFSNFQAIVLNQMQALASNEIRDLRVRCERVCSGGRVGSDGVHKNILHLLERDGNLLFFCSSPHYLLQRGKRRLTSLTNVIINNLVDAPFKDGLQNWDELHGISWVNDQFAKIANDKSCFPLEFCLPLHHSATEHRAK
mmetsp:Transcript_9065/g.14988  ORF Transcript_9065/g.14988 Transcript_9065/m.14988 type:complete len:205 (-) Transcript_9065:581-1195(-)